MTWSACWPIKSAFFLEKVIAKFHDAFNLGVDAEGYNAHMPRFPFWLIILVILALGTPVVAMLMDRIQGAWSATGIEHDGSVTTIVSDRNLQRPDWAATPDGASIVSASHVVNARQHRDVYLMSLSTRAAVADVRSFYRDRLSRAGFVVTDLGTGPMNARTAAFLGVADILSASRTANGDQVSITINTPEGIFATRLVELRWGRFDSAPVNERVAHGAN